MIDTVLSLETKIFVLSEKIQLEKLLLSRLELAQKQYKEDYFIKNDSWHSGSFHPYHKKQLSPHNSFVHAVVKAKGSTELGEYLFQRNVNGDLIAKSKRRLVKYKFRLSEISNEYQNKRLFKNTKMDLNKKINLRHTWKDIRIENPFALFEGVMRNYETCHYFEDNYTIKVNINIGRLYHLVSQDDCIFKLISVDYKTLNCQLENILNGVVRDYFITDLLPLGENVLQQQFDNYNRKAEKLALLLNKCDTPKKLFENHKTYLFGTKIISIAINGTWKDGKRVFYLRFYFDGCDGEDFEVGLSIYDDFETKQLADEQRSKIEKHLGLIQI